MRAVDIGVDLVTAVVLGGAYLLGCLATGYYLVRLRFGKDIRQLGSGNIGATNVSRLLGWRGFLLTLLGDAGKGAAAVLLAFLCQAGPWTEWGALVAVVAGHIWPVQLQFRGGKGAAAYLGAIWLLDWRVGLLLGGLSGFGILLTRRFTVGGLVGIALLPMVLIAWGYPLEGMAGAAVASMVLLWAHRANIQEWRCQIKLDEGSAAE